MAILDISKTLLYDFHYNFIKVKYPGDESKLMFSDTDSLLYRLKSKDVHRDMLENSDLFDVSDYPNDHPCFKLLSQEEINAVKIKNKKVIGKFKDELQGADMLEFVGLRSKAYSFRYNGGEVKKLKGIKKSTIKNDIQFTHYKRCLMNCIQHKSSMNSFRSRQHQMQSIKITKTSLSSYDDKRWLCSDGVKTLPYGHKDIRIAAELSDTL